MKKKFIVYLISLFLLSTASILVIGDEPPLIMNFDEFITDYQQDIDNESRTITYYFQSLNPEDTLIIKDTINTISYNATGGYTSVEFISYPGDTFPIEGDITNEFTTGDAVQITVHIISTSFTDQNPYTGETWTFNIETFEELWDNENKTYKSLPSEYIHLINNNRPLVARFTYSIDEQMVTFTDTSNTSNGSITSWHWDFGDGISSTLTNPTHRYENETQYYATLTVTDNDGNTDTYSKIITLTTEEDGNGTPGFESILLIIAIISLIRIIRKKR